MSWSPTASASPTRTQAITFLSPSSWPVSLPIFSAYILLRTLVSGLFLKKKTHFRGLLYSSHWSRNHLPRSQLRWITHSRHRRDSSGWSLFLWGGLGQLLLHRVPSNWSFCAPAHQRSGLRLSRVCAERRHDPNSNHIWWDNLEWEVDNDS